MSNQNNNKRNQSAIGCLVCIICALLVVIGITLAIRYAVRHLRPAETEEHADLVVMAAAPVIADPADLGGWEEYVEGEGPAPAWWNPDEPMAVEWYAPVEPELGEFGFMAGSGESCRQIAEANSEDVSGDFEELPADPEQVDEEPETVVTAHPPVGIDPGGIDWNVCTTLWGWDGHSMEVWEMDLYSRIVYLEFWGTSPECCEAGADSILQLWDAEYYGRTIGETLTARADDGSLVYSPYAYVWDWDYDPEGLADMRALCEERFANGPEWSAPFFRLNYYHPWAIPCYQIDNVFFSTAEGWQ